MAKIRYLEACQLRQLLNVLDDTDGLEFPVCVEHREQPDFVLTTRSSTIGLEITSFTDEEVRRADHLAIRQFPNAFIPNAFTTNKAFQGMRRTPSNKEIIDTMFNWETPGEDVIETAEHLWESIVTSVQTKQQKFHSAIFEKFDENWLMLSDYPNPFSDRITEDILSRHLGTACKQRDVFGPEFDRIYILYGRRRFTLRKTGNLIESRVTLPTLTIRKKRR